MPARKMLRQRQLPIEKSSLALVTKHEKIRQDFPTNIPLESGRFDSVSSRLRALP